jgi:glycosyltransferase involved in cell wall biosynthesis
MKPPLLEPPATRAALPQGAAMPSAERNEAHSNAHAGGTVRVLHLAASLAPSAGGVAEAVAQLARNMARWGCVSEIATLDAPHGPAFEHIDAPVHRLGSGHGFYGFSPALLSWLRAHRARFDAFIVHGIWQFHSLAAWGGAAGSRIPLFVFPHGMLDPWFQRTYPAKHLKKRFYWALLEHRVFDRAESVLFTCEMELELARHPFLSRRHRLAVNGFGIDAVPVAIDPEAAADAFRDAFPLIRGKRTLLFLSRIHEKKGCDLLIDAFAEVAAQSDELCLVIAGPGAPALLEQLRHQAEARGLGSRIAWTGMLSGKLKWGALRAAEALVLPSHQENFGIAVVEALAARTPVIITNKVNIWREIEASNGGWVCTDTLQSVAQALRRWVFETTPAQRCAMRDAAFACYERHFRIEAAAQQLVGSVRAALGRRMP